MNRRQFIFAAPIVALVGPDAFRDTPQLSVFKSASCGCCSAWAQHMEDAGFEVVATDVDQDRLWALKERMGVIPELSSCHMAVVEGYVVEGHVPASDVLRLLTKRPEAKGLTVAGMPIG